MKNILSIQSHVVFGHAGNAAVQFPIRRLGVNVWPLNTVQFSNHTQYKKWSGLVMTAEHLLDIAMGVNAIDELKNCDAVLSGYIGSAEQGQAIIDIVNKIKTINPNVLYFCDPVMGHPEKGCFVAAGVSEFLCGTALPASDMIAPNILELASLTGRDKINNLDEAFTACRLLCKKGPKTILVKHLSHAGEQKNHFEMLLVTPTEAWHIARPLVDFGLRQPVGVGDMTSGLFLANFLLGHSLVQSLEHTTAAVYEVMLETLKHGSYELEIVAAQNKIAQPEHWFKATKFDG